MKRYEQGSIGMRPDPEGAWCDYNEAMMETNEGYCKSCEKLADEIKRLNEATAQLTREKLDICDQRDACKAKIKHLRDRIAGLEAAMDARTPELCEKDAEIERLREMNASLQTAFDEANEETQRFGDMLAAENKRIVEREKEIERLLKCIRWHRSMLWGDHSIGHPADIALYREALGNE